MAQQHDQRSAAVKTHRLAGSSRTGPTDIRQSLTSPTKATTASCISNRDSHYSLARSRRRVSHDPDGEYVAWYETPRGEGTGILHLANGKITAATRTTYSGTYEVDEDRFTAVVSTRRHAAGQPTLFGIDEVQIEVTGKSTGMTASCTGAAKQAPELPFQRDPDPRSDPLACHQAAPVRKSGSAGVLVDLRATRSAPGHQAAIDKLSGPTRRSVAISKCAPAEPINARQYLSARATR